MNECKKEKRGGICFYNCDNIEFMKTKPDNYYHLAIVDPPYAVGDTFRFGSSGAVKGKLKRIHKPIDWDNEIPTQEYFDELKRVSKKQIIWGANYFNSFNDGGALIWYKNRGGDTMSQCEIASISGQKKVDYIDLQILTGFCSNEERIHPTQKPVNLYRNVLLKYAKEGFKILDTHGGSMTIARACDIEGFDLDVCEIDTEYFINGVAAFDYHKRQLKLF